MKRFISIWAAIAMIFSFYACDGDKNYTPRNSDTEINRPDDNEDDSDDTGDTGDSGDTGGTEDAIDRSGYEVVNTTSFGYGDIEYWGVAYEGQPEDIVNWTIYLSADEFNTSDWEGTGEAVVLELFSKGESAPAAGTYTVESFYENWYSDFSVGDV